MAPVNLLQLNSDEFKKFLDSFDHVFSDCDGVLWFPMGALPQVGEFFRLMKEKGKTVHFVSNNSIRSEENYTKMFERGAIPNGVVRKPDSTLNSDGIYIHDKYVYCVTCSEAKKMIESYGIKTKYGPDAGCDSYTEYAEYLIDDPDIGAVAFDSDFKVNMPKLYKASTYLKRPEVIFLNGPTDKHIAFGENLALGTAFTADVVADLVQREPLGMGKPSKYFGEFAMRRAGVKDPSKVLFIGDMIEQDVRLGKNNGFKTLLLLTHCGDDEMRAHELQPDFYAPSLGSIVSKLSE